MAIILHFGFPKTGTTSQQQLFRANAAHLRKKGIVYPCVEHDFKARPLKHLTSKNPGSVRTDELEALTKAIDAEVNIAPDAHVLISVEEISSPVMSTITPETIGKLRDYLARWSSDVRLVAYVRRPEDFYLSITQELMKRSGSVLSPDTFRTDFAGIINVYEQVFGRRAIVRPFEPSQWQDHDLCADFLYQIRDLTDLRASELKLDRESSNQTLSAEVMAALNILFRFPAGMDNPPRYSRADRERLWRKVRDIAQEVGYTSKPRLYEDVADLVRRQNAEDTRLLEERYGIVFRSSPRVAEEERPSAGAISDVERIVPLERKQALEMVSIIAARNQMDTTTIRKTPSRKKQAATRSDGENLYEDDDIAVRRIGTGSGTAVLSYSPMNHNFAKKGIPAHSALRRMGHDVFGIIAKKNNWYPRASIEAAAQRLRPMLAEYETRLAYGSSMGAYGAIKYSALLQCDRVLALAPQVSIDPADVGKWDTRFTRNFSAVKNNAMRITAPDIGGHVTAIFDPMCATDAQHVKLLADLAVVEPIPAYFCDHYVISPIASFSRLSALMEAVIADNPEQARAVYRSARKASPYYKAALMHYLSRRRLQQNRLDAALAGIDVAVELMPDRPEMLVTKSRIHRLRHERSQAISAAQRAVEVDPKREWFQRVLREAEMS